MSSIGRNVLKYELIYCDNMISIISADSGYIVRYELYRPIIGIGRYRFLGSADNRYQPKQVNFHIAGNPTRRYFITQIGRGGIPATGIAGSFLYTDNIFCIIQLDFGSNIGELDAAVTAEVNLVSLKIRYNLWNKFGYQLYKTCYRL